MKSKAIAMALLAFAFQAQAVFVSQPQAVCVARAWARSGKVLGTGFGAGARVASVDTIPIIDGLALHAVKMVNGSTIFVSGDTALEPVVAFSPAASKDGVLVDILKRDAYLRALQAGVFKSQSSTPVRKSASPTVATASPSVNPVSTTPVGRKWKSLLGRQIEAVVSGDKAAVSAVPNAIYEDAAPSMISDIRVMPFVESRWSQQGVNSFDSVPCYNYYMPDYPCGCAATAVSQIMRYFQFPEVLSELKEHICLVDGSPKALTPVEDEENPGSPKPYAWDKMTLVPTLETSDDEREAIGHLTYDVGVVMESTYTKEETGVTPTNVVRAFREFGYPSAYFYWDGKTYQSAAGGLNGDVKLRQRAILANLDAKLPVQLSIYGYAKRNGVLTTQWGGHAVVADGYGLTEIDGEKTTYVHVNLGWSGSDDAWYNLPEIDTASVGATVTDTSGYDFQFIGGAAFNVTTNDEVVGKELLTGRLTDAEGRPFIDATVTALDGDGNAVGEARPDERGIYFFWLPGGAKYDLVAESDDGELIGAVDKPVSLKATAADDDGIVAKAGSVGNYWGADIELGEPSVRIGGTVFPNLDRALATVAAGDLIEILRPAKLKHPYVFEVSDVMILATNEDAYASQVTCLDGACLTVSNGVTVAFTNIVFATEPAATTVKVLEGGTAEVSGVAVFDDLCSGVPGIVTEKSECFKLTGELLNGITLSCAAAPDSGDVFGIYACETAAAEASAARIVSVDGADRAGEASELAAGAGLLKWKDDAVVVPEVAVAAATVGSADPVYYRSLDRLLGAHPSDSMKVTLLRAKASLDMPVEIAGRTVDFESTFASGTAVAVSGNYSGFTVGAGGALSVRDVTFGGDVKTTFILVKDGGECALGAGAAVRDLNCSFANPNGKYYGPIAVTKGKFTLLSGSEISGCRAAGTQQAYLGGGVYLNGAGCELVLDGGAISNCCATKFGGGVYAHNGSVIRVSGGAKVCGNSSGNFQKDDIYLADGSCRLIVSGDVADGQVGVRYAAVCTSGNEKGDVFATIENGATVEGVSFFNDLDETLMAVADEAALVWGDKPTGPRPLTEEELDRAVVATVTGSKTNYYAAAEEAFEALESAADILVLTNAEFGADLIVKFPVTLRASDALHPFEDDTPWPLVRTQECSLVVGEGMSLTMTNVTVACAMAEPSAAALVDVHGAGAELFLKDGATVCDVIGGGNRASCGIKVWDGAIFTMESGSAIVNCENWFANPGDDAGCGGGLLLDHATAYLHGGSIFGCSAFTGGGVCLANESTAYVSGDMTIDGNADLDWFISNLVIQDLSDLVLDGELTGKINCCEGYQHSNPEVIGTVDENVTDEIAAESAHNFIHDTDGDIGMLVKGDDKRLLVWSNAIAADGTFVDGEGATYELTDAAPFAIPVPWPESGLEYDGEEKEGVLEDFGYTLEGNLATDAGTYTATATLKKGFVWDDETFDPKPIEWDIEKAEYDEDSIIFADATVTYDGEAHFLAVKDGTLPEGVTVSYENNGQVEANEEGYTVTAKFTGDEKNYEPIGDKTAKLVILKATYDMSAIVFHDVDYSETGTPLSIQIEGALPEGVTVEYVYEGPDPEHAAPGVYTVTAKFTGDADNYKLIADMTATMTIVKTDYKDPDDPPGPTPVPVPQPIKITSLTQGADGTWTIVVNPVAKFCKYTLYASDDLESWDPVGEPVISDVDADLTFTRSETDPKKFWKVVGEDGEKPAE